LAADVTPAIRLSRIFFRLIFS